jgi:hypothetical protein
MNAKSMFRRMWSVTLQGLGGGAAAAALLACAAPLGAQAQPLRDSAGAHEVEVLVDGSPTPRYFHAGESYILGQLGRRYTLRVWNRSPRRVEAVVSVDGRDVVDGKPGDFRRKRGYLVPAGGFVDIDGWRLSEHQAAAFRFTSVADSYAARTGGARHVGVIGVAIFPERLLRPRPMLPAPRSENAPDRSRGARDEAQGAPAGEAEASRAARAPSAPSARPGLGTQFGEEVHSPVQEVFFVRENPNHPGVILGVRYNDREGLYALGIDVDGRGYAGGDAWLRGTASPFPVSNRRYAAPPPGWNR